MSVASHSSVKSLIKGIAVMEALAHLGEASAADVAQRIKVPRPTAHRLLETLCETGYVVRIGREQGYRLSSLTLGLARGCRNDDWIAELAEPVLSRLHRSVAWPCDLATYYDGAMVIRATTHHRSSLSLERIPYGYRVPLLVTATGLTYLAFCHDAERDAILETVVRGGEPSSQGDARTILVKRELEAIAERGYGIRIRGNHPKTSTIAIPVLVAERPIGCLNINWIDSAAELDSIVERHLHVLEAAAHDIAVAYMAASQISSL